MQPEFSLLWMKLCIKIEPLQDQCAFYLLGYAGRMKITLCYGWTRVDSGWKCVLSGFSVTVGQGLELSLFEPMGFLPMTPAEQGLGCVIFG